MQVYRGIVQKGKRRGTALGFPTLNIPLAGAEVSGVYAAKVIVSGKEYQAAAFANPEQNVLEAHLLDFSGDLYGKNVEIELFERVRNSMSFSDDSVLRAVILDDIRRVRALHSSRV